MKSLYRIRHIKKDKPAATDTAAGSGVTDSNSVRNNGMAEGLKRLLKRLTHAQIVCIGAACVLTLLAYAFSADTGLLDSEGNIARGSPGGSDQSYELIVDGIGEKEQRIDVNVSAREYTEAEANEAFEALMESMSMYICGTNAGLVEIRHDLELPRSFADYPGIRASWYSDAPEIISDSGSLNNYELTEPETVNLTVILKTGAYRAEYSIPVTAYPFDADTAEAAELEAIIDKALSAADDEQINDESLTLPTEIAGNAVSYSVPKDNGWMKIPALGLLAAVLLGLKPEQDRRRALKQREKELLADYSDIVSKLAIYTGAGLNITGAWIRIADNYTESLKNQDLRRVAYDEVARTGNELRQGVPEGKAFADFAERCSVSCYLRLVSLLEQNRKNGDSRLRQALLTEAREAFELRKNAARQLGEEAGTKLMLPLIISLISIMMMVAVPAMMTLL